MGAMGIRKYNHQVIGTLYLKARKAFDDILYGNSGCGVGKINIELWRSKTQLPGTV